MWNSGKWRRETERYRNWEPEDYQIDQWWFIHHTAGWWAPKKCHPLQTLTIPESQQAVPETPKLPKETPSSLSNCFSIPVFFCHSSLPRKKEDKTYTLPKTNISLENLTIPNSGAMLVSGEGNTYICVYTFPLFGPPGHLGTSSSSARLWYSTSRVNETTARTTFTKAFYRLNTGLEWMCVCQGGFWDIRWGWI